METRRATAEDVDVVVDTLVRAHLDYVWEQWALPFPDRALRLERITRLDLELVGLPNGKVWLHNEGAAVAVWLPSGMPALPVDSAVALTAAAEESFGEHLAHIEEVEELVRSYRPDEHHWFVATMGTVPERRRRGCGRAVLRPMLDWLDAERIPACLETSLDTNVRFYETLGFETIVCLRDLPYGAPDTWVLWRPPALRGR